MNLQELKQSIGVETDMSDIYYKIKMAALDGDEYAIFNHRGCEEEDEITDVQVGVLREQGYIVQWCRACLWYEVSGWK